MSCGGNSVFGNQSQFIKIQGNDIIAVEGVNTVERLIGSDIRIPYKQLLKSRIILKPGQVNYLLNHLGLGDNSTFLIIKATYNSSSVNEEDNYIIWNYYDDFLRLFPMDQLMILTGNSTNRIKQIYLTNPNTKYAVILDVMVASIDDTYSFYTDTINQVGLSFTNLTYQSIETHVINESIVVLDNNVPQNPLAYIILSNINSIERVGKLLLIDDISVGRLYLDFDTEYDSRQANSILNYILNTEDVVIQYLTQSTDDISPNVYFYSNVGNTQSGYTISAYGLTNTPVDTTMGNTFSTELDISYFNGTISKLDIINNLISRVYDNRDGTMSLTSSSITLYDYNGVTKQNIISTGTYSFKFNISDIAENSISSDIQFNIYVI